MLKSNYTVQSVFELASDISESGVPTEQILAKLHHEERQYASRKSEFLEALVASAPTEWQQVVNELAILEEDHRRAYAFLLEHQGHWIAKQVEAGTATD
jgi:hypothetical protein